MKIVCGMIVGPGEEDRYLDHVLAGAELWADEIVTVDDLEARFREDESAVRNDLMAKLDGAGADLVVILDADEMLDCDAGDVRERLEALAEAPYDAWSATFYHLWAPDGRVYRCDGGWAPAPQYRIYRHEPGMRIAPRQLACGAIPPVERRAPDNSGLVILHWGYALAVDRLWKHDRYMALDGGRFHSLAHLQSILGEPELVPLPAPSTVHPQP